MLKTLSKMAGFGTSATALQEAGSKWKVRMEIENDIDAMVIIVGSGFSGLGMAIKLQEQGVPFVVLEKEDDFGGTWYKNTYPGCQCDVPSVMYSYSFEPNPNWRRKYATQREILAYMRRCAKKYNITDKMLFNKEMTSAVWNEDRCLWTVECADGSKYTGKYFVRATGGLDTPRYPDMADRESFKGEQFHSAEWDHSVDLTDKRVAVIGNAASAIQFMPEIVDQVKSMTVFQRSSHWIAPREDREYSSFEKFLCNYVPGYQYVDRMLTYFLLEVRFRLIWFKGTWFNGWIKKQLQRRIKGAMKEKPELTKALTPSYDPGCKRLLLSNDYYEVLNQPHVDVVADKIVAATPHGIKTVTGEERQFDVIIYATGFNLLSFAETVRTVGKGGKDLGEMVGDNPRSLLGVSFNGFPNVFSLLGPNTGLGHNSIIYMIECQINYVMQLLKEAEAVGADEIDAKPESVENWMTSVGSQFGNKVWTTCESWYRSATGTIYALYPSHTYNYYFDTLRSGLQDYNVRRTVL
eukprot:Clim_evm7s216 gene=Clim_evmTU7s216